MPDTRKANKKVWVILVAILLLSNGFGVVYHFVREHRRTIRDNESAAISLLIYIYLAQKDYYETFNRYATLEQLIEHSDMTRHILLVRGKKGYQFRIMLKDDGQDWEATAEPLQWGKTGEHGFRRGSNWFLYTRDSPTSEYHTGGGWYANE